MMFLTVCMLFFNLSIYLSREDKADIVGFLKRMLQQRTDTIGELTDRLQGMKVCEKKGFHICSGSVNSFSGYKAFIGF